MTFDNFTIVPQDLQEKDPRPFAYLYPETIRCNNQKFISFIKQLQRFTFYQSVQQFERFGKANGYILLPSSVLHWRRRSELGQERRVLIGRNTFYFVRQSELNEREQAKLLAHVEEIREVAI